MRARQQDTDPWTRATWDGAESEILAAGARMSLAERLRWLEEASRAARRLPNPVLVTDEVAETAGDPPLGDPSTT